MPHEKINHPRRLFGPLMDPSTSVKPPTQGPQDGAGDSGAAEQPPKDQLVVGWNKIGWVQVSVYPEGWNDTGDAEHVDLNPQELELLIKTLRRAKRQAFSKGNRHPGHEDGPTLKTRPLFKSGI